MTHLAEEQFQQLVEGTLDSAEAEAIWRHLDTCESCLDRLSQWFEEYEVSLDLKTNSVDFDTFQRRLMQRIQREDAMRTMLSFCYTGLLAIFTFLVRSILAIGSRESLH
jgi:anti-sigma factor RsiW